MNPNTSKIISRLWTLPFGRQARVQNFELHAIFENCFKNKRFIENRADRL